MCSVDTQTLQWVFHYIAIMYHTWSEKYYFSKEANYEILFSMTSKFIVVGVTLPRRYKALSDQLNISHDFCFVVSAE